MPEKSGVGETSRARFGGGAGATTLGDAFQPNLAMGGGTYRVPIDLPGGPGGVVPKLELNYDTAMGNGPFGLGWSISLPSIARLPPRSFSADRDPEFAAGGVRLVRTSRGDFVPWVGEREQRFAFDGVQWESRTLDLAELRFGAVAASRVEAAVGDTVRVERWLLDRMRFPGGQEVTYDYERHLTQLYPSEMAWSVFRLRFLWEDRPDPWSEFQTGFEVRTERRCRRIELHDTRRAADTLMRSVDLAYAQAAYTGTSMLERITVTGWRPGEAGLESASLPPLEFGYTGFTPEARRIERFRSSVVPPPGLSDDTTLVDLGGTGLPGLLRLDAAGASFWENRGGALFGPPRSLASIPAGVALSDPGVRFADMEGRGTADLVVSTAQGGGYYPNDAATGFAAKKTLALQPSFDLGEAGSYLLDLDGDRVADLLTFRNREPLAFLNRGPEGWLGPFSLAESGLPPELDSDPSVQFADMTGNGLMDLVRLHSRRITYFPNLGDGRWGEERAMGSTPSFNRGTDVVLLGDVDGDGAADLIVHSADSLSVYLNKAGEGFAEPVAFPRAPRPAPDRTLLADMKGSGTAGLLFMSPTGVHGGEEYWFLDLLDAVKPRLLSRIDNHAGLITEVEYSSSGAERTRDLEAGRRWTGYLPFAVPVVKRLVLSDFATGQSSATDFSYHDGHFDGQTREYLGFAEVESRIPGGGQTAPEWRRMFFHTRHATARDPAFIAARGQPHRTETLDPSTGEIYQLEEAKWETLPVAGTGEAAPAYLAVERRKSIERFDGGIVSASERSECEFDAVGNGIVERRHWTWLDSDGAAVEDELEIQTSFATHAVHGPTGFKARTRKISRGALLKEMRHHYDGEGMEGLPLGEVARGFQTRQVEVALTTREVTEVHGGALPPALAAILEAEADPEFGTLYVRSTGRARVDDFGNQIETIDADGLHRLFEMDEDSINPVSIAEDGGPPRPVEFDPIAQQVSRIVDLNGHETLTRYDPLGFVAAVYRPGAEPGRPTESYDYVRDRVPNAVIRRVRVEHSDASAGSIKIDYRDGCGRICQTKMLSENGLWAVGRQELLSIAGRRLGLRDAYFAPDEGFDPAPPAGTAETQTHLDFAGRVVRERLFNGFWTTHRYHLNRVLFFGPDASAALVTDPATPPTRESLLNAQGLAVMIVERDGVRTLATHRRYDPLQRLAEIVDPEGHASLANAYDLWGNKIRIRSTEGGETVFMFNAANREIGRVDADGRMLSSTRDSRGRVTELREGPGGATLLERFHYDSGAGSNLMGRLAFVEGAFGTAAYSYSEQGRATEIGRTVAGVAGTFVTRFRYNNRDEVTQIVYPDGAAIDYRHDPTGMLASIDGFIDRIDYGPTGLRERIVYANGLESRRRYTPGDYLVAELRTEQPGGHRYQHLVYELDAVGQATKVDDLSTVPGKMRLNQSFEYDGRNRLIAAKGGVPGYDFRYRYDDLGNLLSNGETGEEFVYAREEGASAHPNRLVRRRASAGPEYDYDASGNLTRDPELGILVYDSRHRLVRVERPDGSRVEYSYDHNDRRVRTLVTRGSTTESRIEIEGLFLIEEGGASKIVMDESRRMAVIPATGDAVIHHYDRLGNVNVLSNAATGAFAGHDEYTPYGRLFVSILLETAFTFQGGRFSDGLEIVLLGARFYRPAHGRFLTCDPYLVQAQDKIPPLHSALNFYLYAYDNPTNFTDPTGEIAPLLIAIIVAAIVGAILGGIAAGVNGARTPEEVFLYILGGAIGGVLSVLFWYGILVWLGVAAATAAIAAFIITAAGSFLSLFTPLLDNSNSGVAWVFSWIIKLIKSPVLTILGVVFMVFAAIGGSRVDFRRGALFVEVGGGNGALTLGGVVYTQSANFQADGTVRDDLARHESYHTRTVAALGEGGFYVTYLIFGGIFALASGGPWLGLNARGCGNPFETHAYTFYNPNFGGPSSTEVGVTSC